MTAARIRTQFPISVSSHQPSAISHQPSAISHQPTAISHQPSASRQPSAVSRQPSAISHQPSAISHQPSAISLNQPLIQFETRSVNKTSTTRSDFSLRPLLMLSQNVVLFCQKGTTDKKNTSCPKRSLLDQQKRDNTFGQPHPVLFYRPFGQIWAVLKCHPF